MTLRPLIALLLAPALLLALAPAASAEPCVHFHRDIPLPFVGTPGVSQPDRRVEYDPPKVGPLDAGPVGADVPGFTLDPVVVYDGTDTDVEFEHCV